MLEQLWNSILEFTSRFVIPDWEAAIRLLPVVLLIVIVIWLILTVRRFATAGPTRRGKTRRAPIAPAHVHMPGGSWAPVAVAIGAFLVFWGLVVGGMALWVGVAVLVLTLLLWGREALREYDALGDRQETALTVVHAGPPPGVHMPGPSFRPILASLGVAVLFYGLVFGGWLLAVGILLTIVTLLGWLVDARRESVKVVEADETGHLENIPEPRWPRRLLWIGALLVALAVVFDAGIVPPRPSGTAAGGPGEPGASGDPGTQPGTGGTPASGEPIGSTPEPGGPGGPPTGETTVVAEGVQFTTQEVTAPAGDFPLLFDNRDQGTPHDVDILGPDGGKVFDGDVFPGPEARTYEVTGIEAGSYQFVCSVHPNMTGTITVE